jgi:hypothetical protein
VPGAQEERRQPPTDDAGGAREKYSHQRISLTVVPREATLASRGARCGDP